MTFKGTKVTHDSTRFQRHGSVGLGGHLTTPGPVVAICKHILAVILDQLTPSLFPDSASPDNVSIDESSGWAGGWGG